jgi:hypothetical protein
MAGPVQLIVTAFLPREQPALGVSSLAAVLASRGIPSVTRGHRSDCRTGVLSSYFSSSNVGRTEELTASRNADVVQTARKIDNDIFVMARTEDHQPDYQSVTDTDPIGTANLPRACMRS